MLAIVAIAGLVACGHTRAAAKVAPISLDDLVCCSDAIFVGRVTRVVTLDRTAREPKRDANGRWIDAPRIPWQWRKVPIGEIEVERPFKGVAKFEHVTVLSLGTWACDISHVDPGERALFFLQRAHLLDREDAGFRENLAETFGHVDLMQIAHAGRGRMPMREDLGPSEYVTIWDDVRLPNDLALIEGPEPQYSFIRSITLASLTERVASIIEQQRAVWLRAEAVVPSDPSQSWRFDLSRDRVAKLALGDEPTAAPQEFVIEAYRFLKAREELEVLHRTVVPLEHGVKARGAIERKIELALREPAVTVLLHPLGEPRDDLGFQGMAAVERATGAWKVVRGLFDDARCFDGRAEDADWLAKSR